MRKENVTVTIKFPVPRAILRNVNLLKLSYLQHNPSDSEGNTNSEDGSACDHQKL
jgi:hypothetical protein